MSPDVEPPDGTYPEVEYARKHIGAVARKLREEVGQLEEILVILDEIDRDEGVVSTSIEGHRIEINAEVEEITSNVEDLMKLDIVDASISIPEEGSFFRVEGRLDFEQADKAEIIRSAKFKLEGY